METLMNFAVENANEITTVVIAAAMAAVIYCHFTGKEAVKFFS
jgi:hypothetical protein